MKSIKKATSVILCLLLMLSLGITALAEGSWNVIPTSPEGLSNGDYYLDFSWMRPSLTSEVGSAKANDYLACYYAGTYYLNVSTIQLKGTVVFPAATFGVDQDTVQNLEAGDSQSKIYLKAGLREVGLVWIPVSATMDDLQEGEWYIDFNAMAAYITAHNDEAAANELISAMNQTLTDPAYSLSINPGSRLMKYNLSVSNNITNITSSMLLPLSIGTETNSAEMQFYMDMFDACVKTYHAPEQPSDPGTTEQPSQEHPNVIQRVVAFFLKLINFLTKMFK